MNKKIIVAGVLLLLVASVALVVYNSKLVVADKPGDAYRCWKSCNRVCGPPEDPNYENCMDSCMYTCDHPIPMGMDNQIEPNR